MKLFLPTAFLSLLSTTILALPTTTTTSEPPKSLLLLPRQQFNDEAKDWIWENKDEIGDQDRVEVTIGKGRTSFGWRVPSSTLESIDEECSESSCQPGTELNLDTYYVGKEGWGERRVAMEVDASFNLKGVGSKADMLNLAKSALEQVYNEGGVVERKQGVSYPKPGDCPPSRTHGCKSEMIYLDQWIGISHLHLKIMGPDDATKAWLNIGWSLENDDSIDACAMLTGTGVAMGLVPALGTLSGPVVLGGILCGSGL